MDDHNLHKRQSQNSTTSNSGDGLEDDGPSHAPLAWYTRRSHDLVASEDANIAWWFLTTLVPLLAAILGPLASAFNICALIIDWRTTVSSSSTESEGQSIQDPAWLLAVNGVSLATAIIANLALLLQMVGRLPDKRGSPVTIGGWYIASLLLLGVIASAPDHLPLPTTTVATYSQSFYYAIFASILYFVLATALLMSALALWSNKTSHSHSLTLTFNQRALMMQAMAFFTFLLGAAGVYSRVEKWDYLDAVYYVDVTVFTIGLGDRTPETHLGRSLFFPMATGGILLVGLMIVSMRTLILEAGSYSISTALVEVVRQREVNRGNLARQQTSQSDQAGSGSQTAKNHIIIEIERHRQEFELMRKIQSTAAHHDQHIVLAISIVAFFGVWIIGAVVFWRAEQATGGNDWSFFEALYFTYTCLLTVGYGDFYVQTNSGKAAFVFWFLIALPILTMLIGAVSDSISTLMASAVRWWSTQVAPHGLDYVKASTFDSETGSRQKAEEGQPAADAHGAIRHGPLKRYEDERLIKVMEAMTKGKHLALNKEKSNKDEELEALISAYRLHVILGEMHEILQHLDSNSSRKYSFEEWMWFLVLLMDEDATTLEHVLSESAGGKEILEREHRNWSWMGHESPLMRTKDEPKWILNRLLEIAHKKSRRRGDRIMDEWYNSRKTKDSTDPG